MSHRAKTVGSAPQQNAQFHVSARTYPFFLHQLPRSRSVCSSRWRYLLEMMDANRAFLGLTPINQSAPSTSTSTRTTATVSTPSTNSNLKRVIASTTVESTATEVVDDVESIDARCCSSVASLVSENDNHKLPEPGFYCSDEYMERFNDNWVLDEMMFLIFYYPMVPAHEA
jgi:hypothetical protein